MHLTGAGAARSFLFQGVRNRRLTILSQGSALGE